MSHEANQQQGETEMRKVIDLDKHDYISLEKVVGCSVKDGIVTLTFGDFAVSGSRSDFFLIRDAIDAAFKQDSK